MSGAVKFVVGAALMAAGIFLAPFGGLALAKAGFLLANLGLLEEASKLFTPSPPKNRIRQDVEYSGTVTPRRIIYGKLRVGGLNTIRPLVVDAKGKLLHQILTIAGHPCNAITNVYFNQDTVGTRTAVTGTANDGLVTTGTYANLAWVRGYTGSQTAVDYILNAADSSFWTSSHIGYGLTYAALTFKLDDKVYASGKPEVAFEVEGKKCYDPRLDSSPGANPTNASYIAYTTNPALQLADYLMDSNLGRGIAAAKVDWTLVVAAANECDELVSIPGSTTQKRYESSVMLEAASERHEDNIAALAGAMMGVCYRQGGKYRMYAGAALTPAFTLTEADIVGSVSIRLETPTGEKYNFVRGTFTDATRNYQEVEFEPRGSAAYESADGRRIPKTVQFDTCTNAYQAQRNAIILRRRSRMRKTMTARFALTAYKIRPFIVGTMAFADIGWSAQRVVCTSWKFVGDGTIEMTLQEDSSTIWDDPNPASDYATPGSGTSGTLTSYTPDPPDNLTATSQLGGILFTWDMPLEMLAGDVIELWEHTSSTPFSSATKIWEGRSSRVLIEKDDPALQYYWIRARATNGNTSTTEPASTGLGAVSIKDVPRITPDAEFEMGDLSAWVTAGSVTYQTGGLYSGIARLTANGTTTPSLRTKGPKVYPLRGVHTIRVNIRYRVQAALTGTPKTLWVYSYVSQTGSPFNTVADSEAIDLTSATVGTWYSASFDLSWDSTAYTVSTYLRVGAQIAHTDITTGAVEIDYFHAEIV